ncbi:hypothetical protein K501DRAFT_178150 [Backusella circina FSU 941]|nr:hypothetical protein K501DRAFT_178150 [Backusella circina FSU 941]
MGLLLECIAVTILECFITYYHSSLVSYCYFTASGLGLMQTDLIYHALFVMAIIYQLILFLDTLKQRNTIQLIIQIVFGILLVIFTVMKTVQHIMIEKEGCTLFYSNSTLVSSNVVPTTNYGDLAESYIYNMRTLDYSIIAIVPVSFIMLIVGLVKLRSTFHVNSYRHHLFTGTTMNYTIISWSVLSGLLKLDFFFLYAYAVQLVPSALIGYTHVPSFECILLFAINTIMLLLAIYCARSEHISSLIVLNITVCAYIGYFGYRTFTFGLPRAVSEDPYRFTRYCLLFTTVTGALLMISTLCALLVILRNMVVNKIRISDRLHCSCLTCHLHSNR